ncbi:hypothetical protein V8C86DRAFT_2758249 [Haematococcus lacustris]
MSHTLPSIWIVGVASSGRHSLASQLFPTKSNQCDSDGQIAELGTRVTIDNKYYTATVVLRVTASDCELHGRIAPDDAIILVVSATHPDSLPPATSWGERHSSSDAGVCLMVASHADKLLTNSQRTSCSSVEAQRPSHLDAAMLWCSEHGYEYVECCLTDAAVDAQLQLDGEPQGVARVREALQAHMWPGLTRKPPGLQQPVMQARPAGQGVAAARGLQPAQAEGAAESAGGGMGHSQEPSSVAGQVAGPPCAPAPAGPGSGPQGPGQGQEQAAAATQQGHGDGSCGLPEDEDAFEQLFKDLAGAKASLSQLSDKERREQAAELALRMAALLGEGSGEDSEDAG